MKIIYSNKNIEKVCENALTATKKYGAEMADKIHMRIDQIIAAESVEEMIQFKIGRCHTLSQNRKGQYAVDLVHPYRLIFKKVEEEIRIVNVVNVMEIVDYH